MGRQEGRDRHGMHLPACLCLPAYKKKRKEEWRKSVAISLSSSVSGGEAWAVAAAWGDRLGLILFLCLPAPAWWLCVAVAAFGMSFLPVGRGRNHSLHLFGKFADCGWSDYWRLSSTAHSQLRDLPPQASQVFERACLVPDLVTYSVWRQVLV